VKLRIAALLRAIVTIPLLCVLAGALRAQTFEPDEVELSYIYAAVMGTGTYRIRDRRISMFRLPFSWRQHEPGPNRIGREWRLPLVVGYDDLSRVDSDWIQALLPDQLVTLTVLPGLELAFPVRPNWTPVLRAR